MKVVVGLGNPGRRYENTRHNVGFEVLAELSRRFRGGRPVVKFEAHVIEVTIFAEKTLLLAPQTFMNLSGRSVGRCVGFYQLPPPELLVVCDDMNLPVGRLRLRPGGSAGGQKGLDDIIRHLRTEDFARLRIGIGRPPDSMDSSAYVLSRFSKSERKTIDEAVVSAADGVERWIESGLEAAMNRVNAPAGS